MKQTPSVPQPSEPQKRRHYDEQFKRDALALIKAGRPVTQLARELGISHWNLRDWRRLYEARGSAESRGAGSAPANGGAAGLVELTATVADLRRELEAVQRQRDILKKALAIVAQENPGASRS
jgi:transposase